MLNRVTPPFGVSAGTTQATSGTVSFSNASGVTFGLNGQTLTAAVATNYAGQGFTTATTTGTQIKGTLSTNGLSLGVPAYITTAAAGAFSGGMSTNGNTSGNTGFATDRLCLIGGNNITLSGSTNAGSMSLTISGANVGGAQTGISGVVVSDTTYTSGTVSFSNQNNITIGSSVNGATQYIRLSVGNYITTGALSGDTSKYVQAWELTGNTAGTTSSLQGTKIYFEGGNSITVSGNSNTVKLSVGAYITTADLSQNSSKYGINWKLTGNTAGTTSSAQGTDWWFAGGNSLTVSGSSNTISFSVGNYITTADLSANSSKYVQNWKLTGNTAGTTSSAQGTDLWFSGGNSLTVSGNSNTIVFSVGAYITTADLSQNSSKYVQNWKLTGNTAGTTSSAQGTDLWLSGGQGLTVSGNSNTVVFSVGSYITTADLSANSSNYFRNWKLTGNTAGTTSSQQGTDFWLAGGNGITVSGSSNTISLSVGNYLTTAALSGDTSKYMQAWQVTGNVIGTTSSLQGTKIYFSGGNNITVGGNSNTIAIFGPNMFQAGISGGNTDGDTGTSFTEALVLAGGDNITLSGFTDAGTISITIIGATVAGQPVNFSAGTTSSNLGSVVFSNSNGISFGLNGSTITAKGGLSFYASSNTTSTTSGTGSMSISMAGAGAISVAASNSGFIISGPATSSLSATGWASISTNGSTISIGASTTMNVYAVGNTTSTSSGTVDIRTLSISGAGEISVAASNSGFIISSPLYFNSFLEPVMWNGANTATTSQGLATLGLMPFSVHERLSFSQLNLIGSAALSGTFAGSANTITASIGGASSFGFSATASITNSNIISYALFTRGPGNDSNMLFTVSTSSAHIATAFVNVINVSATGGAQSLSVSGLSSMSVSITFPSMTSGQSINGASSWTTWAPGYTNTNSSTTASASAATSTSAVGGTSFSIGSAFPGNLSSFWQSQKIIPLPFAGSLTPGEYWLGVWRISSTSSSISTSNNNVGAARSYTTAINWSAGTSTAQITWAGSTNTLANSLGFLGAASQATMVPSPGLGTFSATYATNSTYANAAGQPNGAIAFSNINSAVSMFRSWMQLAVNRI